MLIKYIRTPKHFVACLKETVIGPSAYLREVGGEPIGIVVSTDRGVVGWSLCNPKDHFSKEMAKKIAINRADYYGSDREKTLLESPDSIHKDILKMYERSEKYFK